MSLRKNLSYLLFPFSIWYGIGVRFRNLFYSLKTPEAPHITTIGVGNLSSGGTGKTPHVEYLLRLLADRYPTAMLSRGYKRKTKGYVLDDGSHDAARLGDEPAMIARKFPQVQVAVCEKRVEGVRRLMASDNKPQLVILDDVFQHRAIKPSINILLTEYSHPYYRDHILPFGDLREFKKARFRASFVIVTKCPAVLNPVDRHNITHDLGLLNYQKVFFSYLTYGPLQTLEGEPAYVDFNNVEQVLAVTGIAHPEPMVAELKQRARVQHLPFADHHAYTKRDIARIQETFEAMPGTSKIIVTTEKDAVRLRGLAGQLPVFVLPIQVAFHKEKDLDIDQVIDSAVRENISFLTKLSIWT
jgi:tetraacyldisaccharide 4'-kinase